VPTESEITTADRTDTTPAPPRRGEHLLLRGRIGGRAYALPVSRVGRILSMAAPTPLPDAPIGVVGIVNVHGVALPVVDPRPRLGLETPVFHPDRWPVVVASDPAYLLWVDQVDEIALADEGAFDALEAGLGGALASHVVRLGDELIPVLALEPLAPRAVAPPAPAETR
jgi:chemotaxis signal transduction protein